MIYLQTINISISVTGPYLNNDINHVCSTEWKSFYTSPSSPLSKNIQDCSWPPPLTHHYPSLPTIAYYYPRLLMTVLGNPPLPQKPMTARDRLLLPTTIHHYLRSLTITPRLLMTVSSYPLLSTTTKDQSQLPKTAHDCLLLLTFIHNYEDLLKCTISGIIIYFNSQPHLMIHQCHFCDTYKSLFCFNWNHSILERSSVKYGYLASFSTAAPHLTTTDKSKQRLSDVTKRTLFSWNPYISKSDLDLIIHKYTSMWMRVDWELPWLSCHSNIPPLRSIVWITWLDPGVWPQVERFDNCA